MRLSKFGTIALLPCVTLALAACGSNGAGGGTRDSIRAVGSSTVYPFAKAVSEQFAKDNPQFKSPLIESTGSGGGFKLFCAGAGPDTPDISDASRRMKKSEFDTCQQNGVQDIVEIQVGLDGIAFAATKGGIDMNLSPKIIYEALAAHPYGKDQTAKTWHDVDPSLPDVPILVYGPPSTSGTRDALKELILEKGCDSNPAMETLKASDSAKHDQVCTEIRADGAYVDQGEEDNLIVQKIEANPKTIGIFGYSYLEENHDRLNGLTINSVEPTYDNISSFKYPGARPLFIYVKKSHVDAIPGLKEFVAQWPTMWSKDGPLAKIGLVAAPDDVLAQSKSKAETLAPTLTGDELK